MRITYLGPDGSFSHDAAINYGDKHSIYFPVSGFNEVVDMVVRGKADIGVLPLENSTEGVVTPVIDLLYESREVNIIAEIVRPIVHGIYSITGLKEDVQYIYSNAQPLEQCRNSLRELFPLAQLVSCESTAKACLIAKEKGKEYAAVANINAARVYGLLPIMTEIQDNEKNATRFVIISKELSEYTGNDRTSIAFTFSGDSPGNLFKVLKTFAEANINLSRIESRPIKEELGKYIFYVDFIGHINGPGMEGVIDNIRNLVTKLRVLGSYPIGN